MAVADGKIRLILQRQGGRQTGKPLRTKEAVRFIQAVFIYLRQIAAVEFGKMIFGKPSKEAKLLMKKKEKQE